MNNPVYHEYRRSMLFGLILVLLLSVTGATIHYLRSVDYKVLRSKDKLNIITARLDSEFTPVLTFAEAIRRMAIIKLGLPPAEHDTEITVLQLGSAQNSHLSVTAEQTELQMLQRLWPYFELASQAQSHLVGMYYISERGFAVNGQARWPDYVADQFTQWLRQQPAEMPYQRDMAFYGEFLPQQAALTLPLYFNDVKLGRFVFALSLQTMLTPLHKQNTGIQFMLLDSSGDVIHSSTSLSPEMISGHMLQVQRLNTMPWSLALLEQKASLFAAGVKDFLWYWFTYLIMLASLLAAMQYRYRRRTLSAFNRLQVHIDRLLQGQAQGVRHIPHGWRDIFERISQLAQRQTPSK